ncbi:g9687 [Coccomyxa viridis]|uniref:Queuosine 5'-phosphate N-glycosylase/hydrolase n=1 Tax=Coccomyxa viridis TaxID=1274662 RepID=A0ABP1G8F2_9CHLO
MLVDEVRKSCKAVEAAACHVRVSIDAVGGFVNGITREELLAITSPKAFDSELHFFDGGPRTVQYLLAVDTINFAFWPEPGLEYEHLARGFKEALQCDPDALSAQRLSRMTGIQLQTMLSRPGPLPAQEERAALLCEVGSILLRDFGGEAAQLVTAAGGSAAKLVDLVVESFPGFRDVASYRGREVWFLKRAQIFAGDVWGAFQGQGLGNFHDIGRLTMFADYRVPVLLRQLGILQYSSELASRVDSLQELPAGCQEEVEIRACTIQALDNIKAALKGRCGRESCPLPHSVQLDWFLWEQGERQRTNSPPHHRTVTTFY